jgi:alkylation response protein AidB-like acyl-CoA dehydrogenase
MAAGGMGGGSTQVRLDYGNKDAMTAQVEEILEKNWYPGGIPICLVNSNGAYSALPLAAPSSDEQKP